MMDALVDDGNTDDLLSMIAALKPNNFNNLYNELMAISPYLSDTVLISFMLNPVKRPAHKKNVVLANSPLPYKVRPYIDLMNINQNFKNQIWAAQDGLPNARVMLKQEVASLDFQRQHEINELAISTMYNTLG